MWVLLMTRPNYGPQAKKRARRLLEVLLGYANDEFENCDHQQIQTNWQTENHLVIRTKVRFLEELTAKYPYNTRLSKEQIKEALKRFEDFLEILEDNRTTTRGAEDWHFTLKLWHRRQEKAANLKQFEVEWERRRPAKSKQVAGDGLDVLAFLEKPNQQIGFATANQSQDWGEAGDVSVFYGRTEELATLKQWIIDERCRLVTILGMGGIGKTALSIHCAEQIQGEFEYLIWRSLRNAPPVEEILADAIKFLSNQQEIELPASLEHRVSRLIEYLRNHRCLLILDNAEAIMRDGERTGYYQKGYEGYGQLIRRVGEVSHQSCLLLTSREKPKGISSLESNQICSLQLYGLKSAEGEKIFSELGDFIAAEDEWKMVVDHYAGNPLALKIVATLVRDLFDGNLSKFKEYLQPGQLLFDDISDLLERQFNRLTDKEKEIMYWIALNREPVSFAELSADLICPVSQRELANTLISLLRRAIVDRTGEFFTQQPVVMEYMTFKLIHAVCEEIKTGEIALFNSHSLLKATAKDYVRNTQSRLVLKPVEELLLTTMGGKRNLVCQLMEILSTLQAESPRSLGYVGGNILNLLCHLQTDLTGYNFSNLSIWQAHLQGVNLHRVNFTNSDLARSVFTQTFGSIFSVSFSPDGKLLASCDGKFEIRLWRVADGQQILTFKGHTSWIWSVCFSPDSQTLASGSFDTSIRLWDVRNGECIKILPGHTNWVRSVAFSPDGQILASGSDDHTVRLWNLSNGECIKILQGHTNWVRSVAFSSDGQILASGSYDFSIRCWISAAVNASRSCMVTQVR